MDDLLSLFPPGSEVDADGMLLVGGCRADQLAGEFGTPVLVVAETALRDRAREYRDELASRWPSSRVVFASKAFPCTAVQRVMADLVGVPVTGAYCHTMANNYNGNRRIPVVFARDGHARAVVRRGTWDDLVARDVD